MAGTTLGLTRLAHRRASTLRPSRGWPSKQYIAMSTINPKLPLAALVVGLSMAAASNWAQEGDSSPVVPSKPTDLEPADEPRALALKQLEALRGALLLEEEVYEALRAQHNGTPESAVRINLAALVFEQDRANMLPPLAAEVTRLRFDWAASIVEDAELAEMHRLDAGFQGQFAQSVADQILELESELSMAPADGRWIQEEAIAQMTATLEEALLSQEEARMEAVEAENRIRLGEDELRSLAGLDATLDEIARRGKIRAGRLVRMVEAEERRIVEFAREQERKTLLAEVAMLQLPKGPQTPAHTRSNPETGGGASVANAVRDQVKSLSNQETPRASAFL